MQMRKPVNLFIGYLETQSCKNCETTKHETYIFFQNMYGLNSMRIIAHPETNCNKSCWNDTYAPLMKPSESIDFTLQVTGHCDLDL